MKKKHLIITIFLFTLLKSSGFAGTWTYHVHDHLGSTRVLLDENGSTQAWYDYYPFGMVMKSSISDIESRYKFTGKERDDEGGLNWDYFGARFYDASLARFLSVDPMAEKYPAWSPYTYTLNNPLIFLDPDGNKVDLHSYSRTYGCLLGYTVGYSIVSDEHGNQGFTKFSGYGYHIGIGVSWTTDNYVNSELNTIYELAGRSGQTGFSSQFFVIPAIFSVEGIDAKGDDLNSISSMSVVGGSFSLGIGLGTPDFHSYWPISTLYSFTEQEFGELESRLTGIWDYSIDENNMLIQKHAVTGETFVVGKMVQINEYTWVSEDVYNEMMQSEEEEDVVN